MKSFLALAVLISTLSSFASSNVETSCYRFSFTDPGSVVTNEHPDFSITKDESEQRLSWQVSSATLNYQYKLSLLSFRQGTCLESPRTAGIFYPGAPGTRRDNRNGPSHFTACLPDCGGSFESNIGKVICVTAKQTKNGKMENFVCPEESAKEVFSR